MPKPSTVYTWANSAAVQDKVAPTSGEQAAGYAATQPPAHNVFNALLNNIFSWLGWLSTMTGADVAVSGSDTRTIGAAIASADTAIASNTTAANAIASTTVLGKTKMATAPVDSANPIAVGTNDPRLAPAGTSGAGVVAGGVKIQSGTIAAATSGTVTFGTAFSSAPVVVLTARYNNTTPRIAWITSAATTTGFGYYCATDAGAGASPDGYYWIAIGT